MKQKREHDLLEEAKRFSREGNAQAALDVYNKLIAEDYKNTEAHFQRGVLFNLKGDFGKAMKCYQTVLELEPAHAESSIALSVLLNDVGRYEDAKLIFDRANKRVRNDSENGIIDPHINRRFSAKHYELAEMYYSYNRYEEALFEYNKAVALDPANFEIRIKIAKVYAKKGFKTKSFEELRKIKSEAPDYVPARMALGLLFFENANVLEARTEWKSVLRKDPSNEEAKMYLSLSETANEVSLTSLA